MKKYIFTFMMIFILVLTVNIRVKAQVSTSALAVVLMESDSGRVVYDNNPNLQRSVASISKIMTAITAIEHSRLDDVITFSEEAAHQHGSRVYIQIGQKIYLKDLIYALMLRSGNDAAWAIAQHVGGGDVSQFIRLMNEKAKEIGMKNSYFENPSGLDDQGTQNVSTAYDMALLMRYSMNNPIFKEITGTDSHRAKTLDGHYYLWKNKHRLITGYDYIIGGKTGYTKNAKRTLVTVAKKDDMELIVVTLSDSNDWEDHLSLFDYGFKEYENRLIMRKGIFEVKELNQIFYLDDNIKYPMTEEEINQYRILIDVDNEDDKSYLLLEKDNKVVYKKEITKYDKSHSKVADNYTIVDLGKSIFSIMRDILW